MSGSGGSIRFTCCSRTRGTRSAVSPRAPIWARSGLSPAGVRALRWGAGLDRPRPDQDRGAPARRPRVWRCRCTRKRPHSPPAQAHRAGFGAVPHRRPARGHALPSTRTARSRTRPSSRPSPAGRRHTASGSGPSLADSAISPSTIVAASGTTTSVAAGLRTPGLIGLPRSGPVPRGGLSGSPEATRWQDSGGRPPPRRLRHPDNLLTPAGVSGALAVASKAIIRGRLERRGNRLRSPVTP